MGRQERARAIVKLAAVGAPSSVREWLKRDEFGGWERSALRLLALLDDPKVAASIAARGATDADIDQELANELVLAALTAALADARKNEGARGMRRRELSGKVKRP
jgi:hypothetical protein